MNPASGVTAPDNGFCFDSSHICVMGYYGSGGGALNGPRIYVEDFTASGTTGQISATKPDHTTLGAYPELSGYYGFSTVGSWGSRIISTTKTTATAFAWRFVSKTEKPNYASGKTINVWGVVDD